MPVGRPDASAILPPGAVTRTSSSAARWWFGANITPTVLSVRSNDGVRHRQLLGVALGEGHRQVLGRGPLAPCSSRFAA